MEKTRIPVADYEKLRLQNEELAASNSALKRTIQELQQQAEFLQLMIDTIPYPVFCKDRQGRYLSCNRAFETFNGVLREEIAGKSVYEIAPRELAAQYQRKDEELFNNPGVQVYEGCIQSADGARHDVIFHKATFARRDGAIAGLVGAVVDVTSIKQTEETLQQVNKVLNSEIETRKSAEAALSRSVSLLRATLESTADGILVVDGEGKSVIDYNEKFRELWHIPEEVNLSRDYSRVLAFVQDQLVSPDEFLAGVKALYDKPEEESLDIIHFRDGRVFESYSRPQRIGDNISGRVCSFRDITERKRVEERLRASEEMYSAIFANIGIGVAMISPDLEILFLNPVMQQWNPQIDLSKHHICYERFNIPPRSEVCPYCPVVQTLRDGKIHDAITETPQGDRIQNFRVISAPVLSADGAISAVIEVVEDITELKRAQDALRESREFLNALLESTSDAVFATDLEGRYRFCNSAAARNVGKNVQEVLGKDPSALFPEEEARAIMEIDRSLLAQPRTITYEKELTFKGEQQVAMTTKGVLRDEQGRPCGIFGISRNVTAFKKLEAERLETERRLLHTQKLESLGLLAGGIAHDFNNLLAVVLGNLDMTRLKLADDSPAQSNIEKALKACRRSSELIRQLLDYAGKGLFELSDIDINDIVRENAALLRTTVTRNIELAIATSPEVPSIKADRNQIQQIIMNLIINAAEAIGDCPGTITIETGAMDCDDDYLGRSRVDMKPSPGRFVYLEVADTGCGMDEKTRAQLFEPFYTTKFMGRGLGMAAVMGIVRAHRGAILLESDTGRGSVFRVLFPVTVTGQCREPDMAAPADAARMPGRLTGKVLIVDDEETVLDMCMAIVEHLGFQACGAVDGAEALKIFSEHADEITLVILDMTMPKMGGLTTLNELRRMRSDVNVLLISGYSEENVSGQFAGDRPSGFIQKPFSVENLRDKIAELMGKERHPRAIV